MNQYDPLETPDPEEWLVMDEAERILLAEQYHKRARIRLPNVKLHAVMHVIVENQIALGDEVPAQRTLRRLMAEGLDRHQAIHAISSVLAGHLYDLTHQAESGADSNQPYFVALERLTAESWQRNT
jgi:hypothetical protein